MSFALRLLLSVAAVAMAVSAGADEGSNGTEAVEQTATASTGAPSSSTGDTTTTSIGETTESSRAETSTSTAAEEIVCSASGVERPGPQPELPAAAAERREAILSAALECDIAGLEALTGPSFTASFGGGDPVEVWTAGEEEIGSEPLRALVEILRLPPTVGDDGNGGVAYTWPPAFSYQTWEEVPEADREALRVLYDDGDLESFALFGGYTGYRASIIENGTWTVFVAGD